MYCQYCGKELEDGAKFCTECGKAVPKTTKEMLDAEIEEAIRDDYEDSRDIPRVPHSELYEEGFFFKGVSPYNKVGIAVLGLFVMLGCALYTFCMCYPDIWREFLGM